MTHVPDRVVGVDADKRIAGHGHAMRGSSVGFSGARLREPAIDKSAAAADARFSAVEIATVSSQKDITAAAE